MWRLGQQRAGVAALVRRGARRQAGLSKQRAQAERAHAHAATAQEFAARQRKMFWIERMMSHRQAAGY